MDQSIANPSGSDVIALQNAEAIRSPNHTSATTSTAASPPPSPTKDPRFLPILFSLLAATFASALDQTAVSTALPTIVEKLSGSEFVWVGSAYLLAGTAFLPTCGGLAQIFGRRPVVIGSLLLFCLGSGLCGGAKSMGMLIAGRTVQGLGSAGILSLTEIIIADLVPLAQRGTYIGILGAVWAVACVVGPPIGGAFSQRGWRWLFYMNVPLSAIATVLVWCFLQVKAPTEDMKIKIRRMDWTGNILIVAAASSTILALTWGGVRYSWSSFRVLVPLIVGAAGLAAFGLYERKIPAEPVIPWTLFKSRTTLAGYSNVFWHGLLIGVVTFYLPVYFQAVKLQSPVQSGVSFLALAITLAAAAMVAGPIVTSTKRYRPLGYLGWAIALVGIGLLTLLHVNSSKGLWLGVQFVVGIGLGIMYVTPTFAILAPLPLSRSAQAVALTYFVQEFAMTWGVTIGSTILQNQLQARLPQPFLSSIGSGGVQLTYAIIPIIPSLPEPLQTEVRVAFAESLRVIWFVMLGICGAGVVSSLPMQEIAMPDVTDDQWGLKIRDSEAEKSDTEKVAPQLASEARPSGQASIHDRRALSPRPSLSR